MQDVTFSVLHAALRGLATRQRTIADNVANLETPNFRAGLVDFESSLAAALEDGTNPLTSATPEVTRSAEAVGPNGNNVNLEHETLAGAEANLQYQLVANAMSNKFGLLRTAINGR